MEKKANIVFLMGMPGCGKTHWAKLISQEFALPYIDLDQEIAVHEKNQYQTYSNKMVNIFLENLKTKHFNISLPPLQNLL